MKFTLFAALLGSTQAGLEFFKGCPEKPEAAKDFDYSTIVGP